MNRSLNVTALPKDEFNERHILIIVMQFVSTLKGFCSGIVRTKTMHRIGVARDLFKLQLIFVLMNGPITCTCKFNSLQN